MGWVSELPKLRDVLAANPAAAATLLKAAV
jgi:hypothetical protein